MNLPPQNDAEAKALAELEDAAEFASRRRTLKEIGDRIGRCRESVRQYESAALAKLRRLLERETLDGDARVAWLDGGDDAVPPHGTMRRSSPWF